MTTGARTSTSQFTTGDKTLLQRAATHSPIFVATDITCSKIGRSVYSHKSDTIPITVSIAGCIHSLYTFITVVPMSVTARHISPHTTAPPLYHQPVSISEISVIIPPRSSATCANVPCTLSKNAPIVSSLLTAHCANMPVAMSNALLNILPTAKPKSEKPPRNTAIAFSIVGRIRSILAPNVPNILSKKMPILSIPLLRLSEISFMPFEIFSLSASSHFAIPPVTVCKDFPVTLTVPPITLPKVVILDFAIFTTPSRLVFAIGLKSENIPSTLFFIAFKFMVSKPFLISLKKLSRPVFLNNPSSLFFMLSTVFSVLSAVFSKAVKDDKSAGASVLLLSCSSLFNMFSLSKPARFF